jgi:hypothetical protein
VDHGLGNFGVHRSILQKIPLIAGVANSGRKIGNIAVAGEPEFNLAIIFQGGRGSYILVLPIALTSNKDLLFNHLVIHPIGTGRMGESNLPGVIGTAWGDDEDSKKVE